MSDKKTADFVKSKREFNKQLFSIAIPIALQNLMLSLVGASDALMLGRLSQNAVAAVSLANQISFIMSLFTGCIIGGAGTLAAQYLGKKDNETVKILMSMSIRICALISFAFFAAAFFFPAQLMKIYTSDIDLISIGTQYLKIVSWSYLFAGLSQSYLLIMKIHGRAARSALISTMTALIDMFADAFLIYGLAGIPKLGVAGCAISTVIVEASALAVCILESHQKDHIHPDSKSILHHSSELSKDMSRISVPILASGLAWGLGYSMHSMIMGHLNADAVAAAAVVSVTQELVACLTKGLSNGASVMIGMLLGQNRLEEAKVCGAQFWKIAFLCGLFNAALLLIIGPIASMFFILTETAENYLIWMMVILAVYLFAYALNTIITCGVFPAGGDTIYDAKSVMISMWCFSLPLSLLGTFVFHWPVMLVYLLTMSDEIIKIPWIYPRYKKYLWVRNLTRKEDNAAV